MLEASLQSDNAFVTLTYSEEALPLGGTLRREDLQGFLKRLRRAIEPKRIRYYGCGEYGEETKRPHYHLCVFGYPQCVYGRSVYSDRRANCCFACDKVRDAWGNGNVQVGGVDRESAQYVAGYVVKKLTRKDDPRLLGRAPEFGCMSLRPGIGAGVVEHIGRVLDEIEFSGVDVPNVLRHGGKEWPLGRYLMRRLRKEVGRDEKVPQAVVHKIAAELFDLRMAARADESNPSVKAQVIRAGQARYDAMMARRAIFEKRKGVL